MIRFLFSKAFLVNLLIAIVLLFVSYFILNNFLTGYTRHGQTVTVPNVVDEHVDDLPELLEKNGFRYEILDSTWIRKKKGAVLEQSPKAGELVKEGRKIYIKINARTNKKVELNLDNVIERDPRIGREILQSLGLKADSTEIKTSEYENQTLAVKNLQGKELKTGDMVYAGAKLVLVVSQTGDGITAVPNLIGKNVKEAKRLIKEKNLSVSISPTIEDCPKFKNEQKAIVSRQNPEADSELTTGKSVTIFFECDSLK